MVVCGNLVRLEIRMGVQVGSRTARIFQARLSTWLHATASLSTIGKPVIELSHAQDYRGGMIVFKPLGRKAHLGGALPQIL
jgi:hypothetical protein